MEVRIELTIKVDTDDVKDAIEIVGDVELPTGYVEDSFKIISINQ